MKTTKFTTAFLILLSIFLFNNSFAQTRYSFQVAGVNVTSENADDLTQIEGVSGIAKYIDSTKTIYLENATINATSGKDGIVNQSYSPINIELVGENHITATDFGGIRLENGNITIFGSGSLTVFSEFIAISINPYSKLTINDCSLDVSGNNLVISGGSGLAGEVLEVNNATLRARGVTQGAIIDIEQLNLTGCQILVPSGAVFNNILKAVVYNNVIVIDEVLIAPTLPYGLQIAGETVTEENASNLSAIDGVSGTVSYNNSTKILTLQNATIESENAEAIANKEIENLTIKVVGNNTITSTKDGICLNKNTEIIGSGELKITSEQTGIKLTNQAELQIKECSVETAGQFGGIAGMADENQEVLIVDNATVKATGTELGSITNLSDFTMLGNSKITNPEGAEFVENLHGVALDNQIVKEQITIEPVINIDQIADKLAVKLYPNPVKDFLSIDTKKEINEISILSINGKKIKTVSTKNKISLKDLASGIYIVEIQTTEDVIRQKIIKK